ncbi:Acyl-CoA dehydrogenase-like protein [Caballeronia hypogeia]|uniref:Acyl-CoA dehydrogenase-like protein n=1 Tax=Caballeronia hypogeia TaxID=1777140 RepID=A0A158AG21_9BURK|nr:acyl-CoA dehydrogenase family protein [Caballeronia hypogeia]SAK56007.1 Acyl-CoA dehydrogenase-like protein [Caballeronia hypogeia]
MDDIFIDAFERLLAGVCDAATVRRIEAGEQAGALWDAIASAGFADVLVPESEDGAGLSLLGAAPLIAACGRHALPLPLAYTMLVRAVLPASARADVQGPVTIAPQCSATALRCDNVPFGAVSDWVLVQRDAHCELWSADSATRAPDGIHASLDATLIWHEAPRSLRLDLTPESARVAGAAITALLMTGALEKILDMTIAWANERTQFGRPIGKFQAIQQQISVLAELVFSARMAANLACPASGFAPPLQGAAAAKGYVSQVASQAAGIAHAVHGAIGITTEHDLNLYTRRLHAWRRAFGAESQWHEQIGAAWLAGDASALDFMRGALYPASA